MSTTLPTTIDLFNCQTFLTPANLSTYLSHTYTTLKHTLKSVSYDFGSVLSHPLDVKLFSIYNAAFKFHCFQTDNLSSIHFKSNLINLFDNHVTPQLALLMSLMKSPINSQASKFEVNFMLSCEALQSFESKNGERKFNFRNFEKKVDGIFSY